MFDRLRKLKYGLRVWLSRSGGQPETIDVAGRSTVLMHAGEGTPFIYLHSTVGESFLWLPFYQTWAKKFRVLVPTHPGFGQSGGFDQIDTIEDMAFHYVEMFDALGLEEVILGGVSLGGWIAAEFADLFRIMQDRAKVRDLLFHDPNSYMAKLVIQDDPDEEKMLAGYQALTVL